MIERLLNEGVDIDLETVIVKQNTNLQYLRKNSDLGIYLREEVKHNNNTRSVVSRLNGRLYRR